MLLRLLRNIGISITICLFGSLLFAEPTSKFGRWHEGGVASLSDTAEVPPYGVLRQSLVVLDSDRIVVYRRETDKQYSYRELPDRLPFKPRPGFSVTISKPFSPPDVRADSILCLADTPERNLLYLVFQISDDQFDARPLPVIPVVTQSGPPLGGVIEGNLYLLIENRLFQLDLRRDPSVFTWKELAGLPGPKRSRAVSTVQGGDQKRTGLFIFGGIDLDDEQQRPLSDAWMYEPKFDVWKRLAEIRPDGLEIEGLSTVGAVAVPSGAQSILLVGADNRILAYHTVPDSWTALPHPMPVPVRNAAATFFGNELVVPGGRTIDGTPTDRIQVADFKMQRRFGILNWSVLVVYMLGMLSLGFFFMRRGKGDSEDYFKGGGRIPWIINGFSIYATMLSSITFMAVPALAYISDLRYYPGSFMILVMAAIVIRFYVPFYRSLRMTSAYEYLEARFNLFVRMFASTAFLLFMVFRSTIVIFLPSLALNAIVGIDIYVSILLIGGITTIYSTAGGIEAIVWSDFIQGVILVAGAVFALCWLVAGSGGPFEMYQSAYNAGKLRMFDFSLLWSEPVFWVVVLGGATQDLSSYTSDQTVVQRYMTTKDLRGAKRSMWFNGIMSVTILIVFYLIGTSLYTFYHVHPEAFDVTLHANDAIFPTFCTTQLPTGLSGLLIAAIFAATMSTLSSNFNSAGAVVVTDFSRRFLHPTEKTAYRTAIASTATVGVLSTVFALVLATVPDIKSVFDISRQVLGMFIGGLGGLFLVGIFMPGIGGAAVMIGLTVAYTVNFLLAFGDSFGIPTMLKPHPVLYSFIGLVLCVAVSGVAAVLFPERSPEKLKGLTYWSQNSIE